MIHNLLVVEPGWSQQFQGGQTWTLGAAVQTPPTSDALSYYCNLVGLHLHRPLKNILLRITLAFLGGHFFSCLSLDYLIHNLFFHSGFITTRENMVSCDQDKTQNTEIITSQS